MNKIYNIIISIFVFIIFLIIFTIIYKKTDKDLNFIDSLYISASFQTFTGSSHAEKNQTVKKIATIQIILSYILFTIILYNILKS